jgi:hypothetical protein
MPGYLHYDIIRLLLYNVFVYFLWGFFFLLAGGFFIYQVLLLVKLLLRVMIWAC